jgi:NADH:quinone reductase (non-electrogenic)
MALRVIVGNGFGGLQAALRLRRARLDVTLIDRRNLHLFQPLTYQVAAGALSPGEIVYPLRAIFKRDRNVWQEGFLHLHRDGARTD